MVKVVDRARWRRTSSPNSLPFDDQSLKFAQFFADSSHPHNDQAPAAVFSGRSHVHWVVGYNVVGTAGNDTVGSRIGLSPLLLVGHYCRNTHI